MSLISTFTAEDLHGKIFRDNLQYVVQGQFTKAGQYKVKFSAAAPADLRLSYSGSGLPFATPEIAYFETPNTGELQTNDDGSFEFKLWAPNSYYTCQGVRLVRPHVHMCASGPGLSLRKYDLKLGPGIPNRSLKHLEGRPDRSYGR